MVAAYCVIDNSAVMTWVFEDEKTSEGDELMAGVIEQGAVAPEVWPFEFVNGIRSGLLRKRLTPALAQEKLEDIGQLPIEIDDGGGAGYRKDLLALAVAHHLTAYDAAYLELAVRRRLPLASYDAGLRAAAKKTKVKLLLKAKG